MQRIILIFLTFYSFTIKAQSPSDLTANQILDSSLTFCGGEKRIAKIKSSSISYELNQPDKSTAIIHEKNIHGQKYVQDILSFTHLPQTTFFDGKKLSQVDGSTVKHIENIDKIEEVKLKTYSQIQYGYKMLGYNLTKLPDKKFDNFNCYVINAKAKNGYSTINFFDKRNYRLIMIAYPNGNKSLMIDYTFKDSVLFNSHIINTFSNSKDKQVLKIQKVDINENISPMWFVCPYTDMVLVPDHILVGKFESSNGEKTVFKRTINSQDYEDNTGKIVMKRMLKWTDYATLALVDEKTNTDNTEKNTQILVKIVSWNSEGYVCHWITEKYMDTQDYKIIK